MRRLLHEERGDTPVLVLGISAVLVLMLLVLGMVDFLGALAVREQVHGALVTATRASARQVDYRAWVLEQRVVLRPPNATFRQLIRSNLELDAAGNPLEQGGVIEGPVQASAAVRTVRGRPAVVGEVEVPIRTQFLGFRANLRLEYTAFPHAVGG